MNTRPVVQDSVRSQRWRFENQTSPVQTPGLSSWPLRATPARPHMKRTRPCCPALPRRLRGPGVRAQGGSQAHRLTGPAVDPPSTTIRLDVPPSRSCGSESYLTARRYYQQSLWCGKELMAPLAVSFEEVPGHIWLAETQRQHSSINLVPFGLAGPHPQSTPVHCCPLLCPLDANFETAAWGFPGLQSRQPMGEEAAESRQTRSQRIDTSSSSGS